MILNDYEIAWLCQAYDGGTKPLLDPFVDHTVKDGVISYGLSSFGYDLRLGEDYLVFSSSKCLGEVGVVDPKQFNLKLLDKHHGPYCIIPPHGFCLGVSFEKFNMPNDLLGICIGKSTYARCGIIVNVTPIEPLWFGYLTIEISNTTDLPVKVYSNEGIAQVLFFRGSKPNVGYTERSGKYQNQSSLPQPPKLVAAVSSGVDNLIDIIKQRIELDDKIERCKHCAGVLLTACRQDGLGLCHSCAREYLKGEILKLLQTRDECSVRC